MVVVAVKKRRRVKRILEYLKEQFMELQHNLANEYTVANAREAKADEAYAKFSEKVDEENRRFDEKRDKIVDKSRKK